MYIWHSIWQSSNHALVSTMTNVAYCWRDVLLTSYKRCDVVNHMSHIWRTCVCGRRCRHNQSEIEWPRALWHCCSPSHALPFFITPHPYSLPPPRLFAVSMSQSLSVRLLNMASHSSDTMLHLNSSKAPLQTTLTYESTLEFKHVVNAKCLTCLQYVLYVFTFLGTTKNTKTVHGLC